MWILIVILNLILIKRYCRKLVVKARSYEKNQILIIGIDYIAIRFFVAIKNSAVLCVKAL